MNNIFNILLIFILITNCSFQKNSKFWTNEKIVEEKQENKLIIVNKKEEVLNLELNPNLKISLNTKVLIKVF